MHLSVRLCPFQELLETQLLKNALASQIAKLRLGVDLLLSSFGRTTSLAVFLGRRSGLAGSGALGSVVRTTAPEFGLSSVMVVGGSNKLTKFRLLLDDCTCVLLEESLPH